MLASEKKIVLVVDDNFINRQMLCKILADEYFTIQAGNGREALSILHEFGERVSAVLLDVVMPVMGGYEFLEARKNDPLISGIPVIVTTQAESDETEIKALTKGATDFLSKPYNPMIIRQRLANMIAFKETSSFVNSVEHDSLTGAYSKEAFYARTKEYITQHPDKQLDMVVSDLIDFKIVNDMFGEGTGDDLLVHWRKVLDQTIGKNGIIGRISGDVFAVLMPRVKNYSMDFFDECIEQLNAFEVQVSLNVCFGIYQIDDIDLAPSVMCDRAVLAIKSIKDKTREVYAFYDERLKEELWHTQQLITDMHDALSEGQFKVYLQAKCDLDTECIIGAEALIRWIHPEKGFMSPAEFIPIFEKNGFITNVDMYVCDTVCALLRKWIDEGTPLIPISINISRTDIYNPNLKDDILECVKKYDVPVKYLHLEITETAYTENPKQLIDTVVSLRNEGFHIEMDDFGSGYSSLNMLSEVPVDTLKLDMGFLKHQTDNGHDGNILNFVINLAKWLDLSVVAEGIEFKEQLNFLRSLGCAYGQGYYFSKPIPIEEFNELRRNNENNEKKTAFSLKQYSNIKMSEIWNATSDFSRVFNEYVGSLAIMQYEKDVVTVLRANDSFKKLFSEGIRNRLSVINIMDYVSPGDKLFLNEHILNCTENNATFDFPLHCSYEGEEDGKYSRVLRIRGKAIGSDDEKIILMIDMEDITVSSNNEKELIAENVMLEFALSGKEVHYINYDTEKDVCTFDNNVAEFLSLPNSSIPHFSEDFNDILRLNDEDKARCEELVKDAREGKTVPPMSFNIDVGGQSVSVEVGAYSFKDNARNIIRTVFVAKKPE